LNAARERMLVPTAKRCKPGRSTHKGAFPEMTAQTVMRLGGLTAIAAGVLMPVGITLRLNGQPFVGQSVLFVGLTVLVFGLIGLYAVQAERAGKLGLAGFSLAITGRVLTAPIAFAWLATFGGLKEAHALVMYAWGVIPILHVAILASDIGAALFGIATVRAAILPRWAGIALILAGLLDIVAEYTDPMLAIAYPLIVATFGAALVGMGWHVVSGRIWQSAAPARRTLSAAAQAARS
jgi:hypothetical protein